MSHNINRDTVIFTQHEIISATDAVAKWLVSKQLTTSRKLLLIPVLDGALPFFNLLCRALDALGGVVEYDYQSIWTVGYERDSRPCTDVTIYKHIDGVYDDHTPVIIDDVYDKGETARAVFKHIMSGHLGHISDPLGVFLVNKQARQVFDVEGHACFSPLQAGPSDWLYGFGMDQEGHGRGLRCIWRKATA